MNFLKSNRSRKFPIFVTLLTVLLVTLLAGFAPAGNYGFSATAETKIFEDGRAFKTDNGAYWVLTLNGSWREMGRQYGGLVQEELRRFYTDISGDIIARGMSYDQQLDSAKLLASTFSLPLNDLMEGIAETSGLSLDEVLILNAGMSNLSNLALGGEPPSACSAIAAWDKYTPDGNLVIGRNWDIDREALHQYMKYLSVVVFNPDSGNSFANIHPLGNVYLETGLNSKGLFIELNNGAYSDPHYIEGREDTVSVLVTTLNRCGTIDEATEYLSNIPADLAHIIQVADHSKCVSVERATFDTRVRTGAPKGILAAYNSFVPPYPAQWEGRVTDPPQLADDPRYYNLLNLANAEKFLGKLDINGMQELMDITVRDGGAVHQGTVYQVIAKPDELTLWVRALDYADWQQVDLRGLFADNPPPGFEVWQARETDDVNKCWTVKFNQPVSPSSLNSDRIYIKDSANRVIPSVLEPGHEPGQPDRQCLVRITPLTPFTPGHAYRLYVTDNIYSTTNIKLAQAIMMPFSVAPTP